MHPQQLSLLDPDPEPSDDHQLDGPSWAEQCRTAIESAAATGQEFQAVDLVTWYQLPEPPDHHQWGQAFLAARADGVIQRVGVAQSRRRTTHRSLLRTWTGTPAYASPRTGS